MPSSKQVFVEKFMRNLQHDSNSVTCFSLGIFASSVFQIFNYTQCVLHCLVCLDRP